MMNYAEVWRTSDTGLAETCQLDGSLQLLTRAPK